MASVPKNHVTAFFRVSPGVPTIDAERGILRGVKLMEVGKVATFAGPDGNPKSVTITPKHIEALLSHAGNRAVPIHWTHEWHDKGDGAEMDARIGALKTFRKDDAGNLVGDAYLSDTSRRPAILWAAEHNPEDTMFSAVFNYSPDDAQAMPLNFRAADIVPTGAATTALFTQTQKLPMDDAPAANTTDLLSQVSAAIQADPHFLAALEAMVKSVKKATPDDAPVEDTAAAEMESAAGVTDEDKKPEDDKKPVMMRAMLRCERARNRKQVAFFATVETKAKAGATAMLGAGRHLQSVSTQSTENDPKSFIEASIASGKAKHVAGAIALMGKTRPELYAVFRAA